MQQNQREPAWNITASDQLQKDMKAAKEEKIQKQKDKPKEEACNSQIVLLYYLQFPLDFCYSSHQAPKKKRGNDENKARFESQHLLGGCADCRARQQEAQRRLRRTEAAVQVLSTGNMPFATQEPLPCCDS